MAEYQKLYRAKNRDVLAEKNKQRYAKNREVNLANKKRYREENPEKVAESKRRHYIKHREKLLQIAKRNRDANPERVAKYQRSYRAEHSEKAVERAREWRLANPERYREHMRRGDQLRRARMKQVQVVDFTKEQLAQKMAYYGHSCYLQIPGVCTGDFDHVDHFKPIAKDGPHMIANFRPACAPCNHHKSDQWPFAA